METATGTMENRFAQDLEGLNLTKEQAYRRLKTKYALRYAGTRDYDQMVRKITEFLEL